MTDAVPVDLLNPGQVLACIGLMEACTVLSGRCEGAFDVPKGRVQGVFILDGPEGALGRILSFLRRAEVVALSPDPEALRTDRWGVTTEAADDPFSSVGPPASSPATLPCELRGEGGALRLSSWGEDTRAARDNIKFWAGSGGYPGAALARDAVALLAEAEKPDWEHAQENPFAFAMPQSSSFRFDYRRDYVPLGAGFSPNAHSDIEMIGYPLVELLAAVGIEHARPARVNPRDKLRYHYAVPTIPVPLSLMRAVLGAGETGLPTRRFEMILGWPGQEGQARCIIDAEEVT